MPTAGYTERGKIAASDTEPAGCSNNHTKAYCSTKVIEEYGKTLMSIVDIFASAGTVNVDVGTDEEQVEVRSFSIADYGKLQNSLSKLRAFATSELQKSNESSTSYDTGSKIFLDDVYNVLQSLDSSAEHQASYVTKRMTAFEPEDFNNAIEKASLLAWKTGNLPTQRTPMEQEI